MEPGPEPVPALDATQLGLTGQNAIWPADHWWQRYGDSQLDALVDEALANSPSMSSAQARLAQANAAVSTARSSLLPKVDANYTLNREHLSKQYIYPARWAARWSATTGWRWTSAMNWISGARTARA